MDIYNVFHGYTVFDSLSHEMCRLKNTVSISKITAKCNKVDGWNKSINNELEVEKNIFF